MIKKVKAHLENNWKNDERILEWHDIRVVDTEKHHVILLGINSKAGFTKAENMKICQELKQGMKSEFDNFEINIKASPIHRY